MLGLPERVVAGSVAEVLSVLVVLQGLLALGRGLGVVLSGDGGHVLELGLLEEVAEASSGAEAYGEVADAVGVAVGSGVGAYHFGHGAQGAEVAQLYVFAVEQVLAGAVGDGAQYGADVASIVLRAVLCDVLRQVLCCS